MSQPRRGEFRSCVGSPSQSPPIGLYGGLSGNGHLTALPRSMPSKKRNRKPPAAAGLSIPKVALLIETSRGYGRSMLRGIVRYSRLHGPWSFYVTPGDFEQALPKIQLWGGAGIIARVDCVVVGHPENHLQTYATAHNPAFAGEFRVPLDTLEPMPLDERKIIARRCAFELPMGGVVNLGIGMPEGVAQVADEEKVLDYVADADRRAGCHRWPAAERPRLRRGDQHRCGDPPEPAVRFLRRRWPRHGVPGHGAGRRGGQRERQPLRPPAGRRRWVHQRRKHAAATCSPARSPRAD